MKKYLAIIIVFLSLLNASPALAFPTLIPSECTGAAPLSGCTDCKMGAERGDDCCCNLSSVEQLGFNIAQIILGVSGALALLMFVIGGVMYIFSQGNPGKVQKATSVLTYAVIGLAIILLSGVAVKLFLRKLTGIE